MKKRHLPIIIGGLIGLGVGAITGELLNAVGAMALGLAIGLFIYYKQSVK